ALLNGFIYAAGFGKRQREVESCGGVFGVERGDLLIGRECLSPVVLGFVGFGQAIVNAGLEDGVFGALVAQVDKMRNSVFGALLCQEGEGQVETGIGIFFLGKLNGFLV